MHADSAPRAGIYRELLKNNVIIGMSGLSTQLQGLLLVPIIIKLSGATLYGEYVLLTSMLLLGAVFSSLGIGYRYRRYLPSSDVPLARTRLFVPGVLGQLISVAIGSLLFVLFLPFLEKLFLKDAPPFHRMWIVAYCLVYINNGQACDYFRYTHRMLIFSLAVIAANIVSILTYLGLAAFGIRFTLDILFGVQTLANAAVSSVLWYRIFREIPFIPSLDSIRDYIEDVKLGFPITLAGFSEMISAVADRYVIGAWYTAEMVGFYAPAFAVGSAILFIPRITGVVLPPLLARMADRSEKVMSGAVVSLNIRLFLLVGIPAIAGEAIVAVPVLRLLGNEHLAEVGRYVVPIIAASSVVYGLACVLNSVLFVERKTRTLLASNLVSGVTKIVFSIVALRLHAGLVGVAVATLLGQVTGLLIIVSRIAIPRSDMFNMLFIGKAVLASLIMVAVIRFFELAIGQTLPAAALLPAIIATGVCTYVLGLFLLRVFGGDEIKSFKRAFARKA